MRFALRLTVTLAALVPAWRLGFVGPGAGIVPTFLAALVAFGLGHAAVLAVGGQGQRVQAVALGVAALLLVGGVGVVVLARQRVPGLLTVAQARAEEDGARVEVRGYVKAGSIVTDGKVLRFVLADGGAEVGVIYVGVPPDTFRDGMEVVARGELAQGELAAQTLLVRCPDNYDWSKGPAPF